MSQGCCFKVFGQPPPKKKVMNSPAGTKGTVDAPYNFLTHAYARIIGIESIA